MITFWNVQFSHKSHMCTTMVLWSRSRQESNSRMKQNVRFLFFLCFSFFYILIQFGCWRRFLFHQRAVLAPLNGHIYVVKLAAFSLFLCVFWGRGATISMQEKQVLVGPLFSALLANHRPSACLSVDWQQSLCLSNREQYTLSMEKHTQRAKDLKQACFPTCKTIFILIHIFQKSFFSRPVFRP